MFLHKRLMKPATALLVVVVGVAVFALPATSSSTGSPGVPSEHPVSQGETSSPNGLLFVENAGQWPDAARFQVWGSPAGYGHHLAGRRRNLDHDSRRWHQLPVSPSPLSPLLRGEGRGAGGEGMQVHGLALKLTFPGANPDVQIEPLNPLTTTVSYFLGNDPDQWRSAVPVYGGVRYVDLYPGVDLVLGMHDEFWRFDTQPGVEAGPVRLHVEGADGAILAGDVLRLTTAAGDVDLPLPTSAVALQVEVGTAEATPAIFHLPPRAPHAIPLTPQDDPDDLLYSTFLGGSSVDESLAIAVDERGYAYVTGITTSSRFSNHARRLRPEY